MKAGLFISKLLLLMLAPLLTNCATTKQAAVAATKPASAAPLTCKGSARVTATDETDEYAVAEVSDPLEGLNRITFKFNDVLYTGVLRPVAKGYELAFPKPVRKGINNVFENAKFPVRFVNCALQGRFRRAGQETGKFFVNTLLGLGGIIKTSDKIPELVDVPTEDTGQTFAKWGFKHGPYIVLPFFGPSSVRDTVGFAGDYALNPVNWGLFWHGGHTYEHDWTLLPPTANTVRSSPDQLAKYDAATENSVDKYLSARSTYMQNRAAAEKE